MASVRPFRAISFDTARVGDLGRVVCPPYDVISASQRDELYARDPHNIVRVVSGLEEPGDVDAPSGPNRYSRAAGHWESWLRSGVLRRDDRPALFAYRQQFADPAGTERSVWGLIATICLDDPILAHEHTMPGPKADRLALMKAVPANLSPIYALYRERSASVSGLVREAGGAPTADLRDDEGTRHTAWAIWDSSVHDHVASALRGLPLLIADGHHRFETAKSYRASRGGPGPWDDVMALLVDAGAEPVLILPYHRIVRHCVRSDVVEALSERMDVTPIESPDPLTLARELWDEAVPGSFVVFTPAGAWRASARDVLPGEIPAATLKRVALDQLEVRSAEIDLSFTPDAVLVAAEVASGRAVCGFLMQPVSVQRIYELAESEATMPEKSTYFHPKPRDGIVMRPLE